MAKKGESESDRENRRKYKHVIQRKDFKKIETAPHVCRSSIHGLIHALIENPCTY